MLFSVLVSIWNNEKEMSEVCKIMLQESQVQTGKRSVSPEKKDEKTIKDLLRVCMVLRGMYKWLVTICFRGIYGDRAFQLMSTSKWGHL